MMEQDWNTVWLTLKLAFLVMGILLLVATPLAWWLSQTRSRYKPLFNAILSLPMVLPPTVLGFYLLLLLGPHGPVGQLLETLHWQALPFSRSKTPSRQWEHAHWKLPPPYGHHRWIVFFPWHCLWLGRG